jgi:hypothetical protein
MSWFLRVSKFGELHVVYSQEAEQSCGLACVIMTNFKMKKWMLEGAMVAGAVPGIGPIVGPIASKYARDSAIKAEKEVYKAYAKVSGQPYNGSTTTNATILPKVLNELGIGTWTSTCLSATAIADSIKTNFSGSTGAPMILLLHWTSGSGHFVVCDSVSKSGGDVYANICDPWDGQVRTPKLSSGQETTYTTDAPGFHVDFFQTHHDYAKVDVGKADGWVICRTGA